MFITKIRQTICAPWKEVGRGGGDGGGGGEMEEGGGGYVQVLGYR